MKLRLVSLLFLFAACSESRVPLDPRDAGGGADRGPAQDGGSTTGINTEADFNALAKDAITSRCDIDREIGFVMSVDPNGDLAEPRFVDLGVHRQVIDFLKNELGGSFAGLDAARWYEDFQHPMNRKYYAGNIVHLSGTNRYGFDVDDPAPYLEGLSQQQLAAIWMRLKEHFQLDLIYLPRTNAAVRLAEDFLNPGFEVVFPELCATDAACPAGSRCVVASPGAELCGGFEDNRDIRVEVDRLIRLNLVPGTRELPTASGPFDLFSGEKARPTTTGAQRRSGLGAAGA